MISKVYKKIKYRRELDIFSSLKDQMHYTELQKQQYQRDKLVQILKIAHTIPFYRKTLEGKDIDNLKYSDFANLPFLTKDDIRSQKEELINRNFKDIHSVFKNTSGGSTGEPVEFLQTREQRKRGQGNYHFANYLNGISPYDPILVFWGALRDMDNFGKDSPWKRIKNKMQNKEVLNTFVMSKEIISSYVDTINSFQPKAIKAYVHSLYEIAKYINENNIRISCSPRIHTSTGPLYPEIKEEIKKAFNNTHVFNFYGSREVSAIATEVLDSPGMTVLYDNVFVEIVDSDGKPVDKGQEGEIVITTLNNEYMPLIRFKIGDRGIKDDPVSTYGTLKILKVLGRTLGVIHRKDGSFVDGQYFTSLFFNTVGIKNFQLIQQSLTKLKLNIVKHEDYEYEELTWILQQIKEKVGQVDIEVEHVQKIDLTSTGKIMYVYSLLDY